jgi:glycosyltransferase involved in cell wall biosynthesis
MRTRNRARLLQTALESVHAQEGLGEKFDVQIIVVDDASSDETPEVCRRFDVCYGRHDSAKGPAAAYNTGLQMANGSYIGFLDDDDLWLPHNLRRQVPILEKYPDVSVVYGQSILVYGDRVSIRPNANSPSGHVFSALLLGNFVFPQTALVRRKAFEDTGPFDESLATHEEYDMLLRIALHHRFAFHPGPIAVYRRSPNGAYSRGIRDRDTERDLFVVLERALSNQAREGSGQLSREVQAYVRLILAGEAEGVEDHESLGKHLLKALQESPWIVGESWGRSRVEDLIRSIAYRSPSPLALLQSILGRARSIKIDGGFKRRLTTRAWLSDVSLKVARILIDRSPSMRFPARAFALSIIWHNPLYVFRLQRMTKLLKLLIVRGSFDRHGRGIQVLAHNESVPE